MRFAVSWRRPPPSGSSHLASRSPSQVGLPGPCLRRRRFWQWGVRDPTQTPKHPAQSRSEHRKPQDPGEVVPAGREGCSSLVHPVAAGRQNPTAQGILPRGAEVDGRRVSSRWHRSAGVSRERTRCFQRESTKPVQSPSLVVDASPEARNEAPPPRNPGHVARASGGKVESLVSLYGGFLRIVGTGGTQWSATQRRISTRRASGYLRFVGDWFIDGAAFLMISGSGSVSDFWIPPV